MVYVDPCFLFGLQSAPKVFNMVADTLCWCLQQAGIQWGVVHYLDDFIIVALPDSDKCSRAVRILGNTCAKLDVPLAADKSEGPMRALVYLSIVIDTMAGEL